MRRGLVLVVLGTTGLLSALSGIGPKGVRADVQTGPCQQIVGGPCFCSTWCGSCNPPVYYFCTGHQWTQSFCQNQAGYCFQNSSTKCFIDESTTITFCSDIATCTMCAESPMTKCMLLGNFCDH